jgi:hypothetical protein|uniref:Uncharacterized protein n=1 Tax=uncultured haloarchaeon TaxID=160804 RepID=A0A0K1YBG0_9EURY|nr:hypothetical protein [uncultured haloarchaeon]
MKYDAASTEDFGAYPSTLTSLCFDLINPIT